MPGEPCTDVQVRHAPQRAFHWQPRLGETHRPRPPMRYVRLHAEVPRGAIEVLLYLTRRLVVVSLLRLERRVAPPADQHLATWQLAPVPIAEIRVHRHLGDARRLRGSGDHLRARRLDLHRWHQLWRVRIGGEDDGAGLARVLAGYDQDIAAPRPQRRDVHTLTNRARPGLARQCRDHRRPVDPAVTRVDEPRTVPAGLETILGEQVLRLDQQRPF